MGDSGYFQRVPVAVVPINPPRRGRTERPLLLGSFAERDTFPAAQRRTSVNVFITQRSSGQCLKRSVKAGRNSLRTS